MRVGILGAGIIASKMAVTIAGMKDVECYAIASRNIEKAGEFKKKYHFEKAYGSYEDLLKDKEVDLVYIATPHSRHFEDMKLCIKYHKAVLCEKAFCVNANQAKEIKEYANKEKVFVSEAMWPRYMPSRKLINDVINSGIIGKVSVLTANLAYPSVNKERLVNPNLAGGALLDLGVYGLNFSLMHFGDGIEKIESSCIFTDTGVDGSETISLIYKDRKMSCLVHSIYSRSDRKGIIYGDKGYIIVENINNPGLIRVYDTDDKLIKEVEVPKQITGYEYEVYECKKCLEEGRIESISMPLSESIKLLEIVDKLKSDWGLKYPFE